MRTATASGRVPCFDIPAWAFIRPTRQLAMRALEQFMEEPWPKLYAMGWRIRPCWMGLRPRGRPRRAHQ